MFCVIAFVVLAILGIFSASHRELAKEALDCVFRRVTLRPCDTGFDEKMKARILGSVITRSEVATRVLNRHFELFSWVLFILMLGSSVWAVRGGYLYYVTGSCNGLNSAAFCVFDPKGQNNETSSVTDQCLAEPTTAKDLTLNGVDLTGFPVQNASANDKIIFIGSYGCDYSRQTYPMVRELVRKNNVSFTYLDYPVKEKSDYLSRVGYCVAQENSDKYWELNDLLFTTDKAYLDNEAFIQAALTKFGLDAGRIKTCVEDPQTEEVVRKQMAQILKTKFYGTPTVFINGKVLVGPKPYRVFAIMLKGLLYW